MTTLVLRGIAIFFLLIVATGVMMSTFRLELGTVNYFDKHGVFFLVFVTFFPRLTLLFSSVATGGVVWWIGFFLCPRVLVASLATMAYFQTNPFLVTVSWLVAISGEFMEKRKLGSGRFVFRTYNMGRPQGTYQSSRPFEEAPSQPIKKDDAIEVEFTKKGPVD